MTMTSSSVATLNTSTFEGLGTQQVHRAKAAPSFYKPELDILRFFAFLGVFLVHSMEGYSIDFMVHHHIPLWAAKSGSSIVFAGMYGVDLFFVLSAYLITALLLREKDARGDLNVEAFYLRRILRIWPLYYLFIALAALIPFLNPHHYFSMRYVLPFVFLMGNWSFIIFGIQKTVAMPLWSISVEEQFYLFWPPLVARLSRRQSGDGSKQNAVVDEQLLPPGLNCCWDTASCSVARRGLVVKNWKTHRAGCLRSLLSGIASPLCLWHDPIR